MLRGILDTAAEAPQLPNFPRGGRGPFEQRPILPSKKKDSLCFSFSCPWG